MREILLSSGSVTIVDDDDYDFLSRFMWTETDNGYAIRMGQCDRQICSHASRANRCTVRS